MSYFFLVCVAGPGRKFDFLVILHEGGFPEWMFLFDMRPAPRLDFLIVSHRALYYIIGVRGGARRCHLFPSPLSPLFTHVWLC